MPLDKKRIKLIKTLQSKLKLSTEDYEMLLSEHWVKSCKDLSEKEADELIAKLTKEAVEKGVWNTGAYSNMPLRKKYENLGKRQGMGSPKQLRMIEAMWAEVSFTHDPHKREIALRKFCLRIAGVDDLTFLDSQGVQKVIRAIESMGHKHNVGAHGMRPVKDRVSGGR